MENKKPKKKSMTSQIKELRIKLKKADESWEILWERNKELRNKLYEAQKVIPEKYFKVKFKIKSNSGHIVESEEIRENFTLNLAIIDIKSNKTHPDTFELIDVKVLN